MSTSTTIRAMSVETLDIPLREPFGIASGAQELARNLLVTVELADGTRGYGEAAPFPLFNGETQAIAARSRVIYARKHMGPVRARVEALGVALGEAARAAATVLRPVPRGRHVAAARAALAARSGAV